MDWERVNPATGPVFINGAEAGDILSVKIDKIEIEQSGVVICGKGMGVMLTSLAGDVRICQVVDPKKTARVEFPKSYLKD